MRCRALLLLQVQKRHSDCPRITSAALQPFAVGISAAEVLGARTYCPSALAGEPALHPTQHTAFDSVAATTGGIAARVLADLSPPLSSASHAHLLPLLRRHLKVGALFGTYDGWAATEELRLRSLLQLLASAGADRVQLQDFIADQAAISWQESALIRTAADVEALLDVLCSHGGLARERAVSLLMRCPALAGQPVQGDHMQQRVTPKALQDRLHRLRQALEGTPIFQRHPLGPGQFQRVVEAAPALLLRDHQPLGHPIETLGLLLHVNGRALAEVLCAAPELAGGDSEEMQQTWKHLDDRLGGLRADLCRQYPQLLLVPAQDVQERLAVWDSLVGDPLEGGDVQWLPALLRLRPADTAARLYCLRARGPAAPIRLSEAVAPEREFCLRHAVTQAELRRWEEVAQSDWATCRRR